MSFPSQLACLLNEYHSEGTVASISRLSFENRTALLVHHDGSPISFCATIPNLPSTGWINQEVLKSIFTQTIVICHPARDSKVINPYQPNRRYSRQYRRCRSKSQSRGD